MPCRSAFRLFVPALLALAASAARADDNPGLRLFNQSCRVCHTPLQGHPPYGPTLSGESLGGELVALRAVISNGTARMPGFRYTLKPAQIDAVAAYIKTLHSPASSPAKHSPKGDSREAD